MGPDPHGNHTGVPPDWHRPIAVIGLGVGGLRLGGGASQLILAREITERASSASKRLIGSTGKGRNSLNHEDLTTGRTTPACARIVPGAVGL